MIQKSNTNHNNIDIPQSLQIFITVSLRISKCYLGFQMIQFLISFGLLGCLLAKQMNIVPYLQMLACVMLLADLIIKYLSQGRSLFFSHSMNLMDMVTFFIIIGLTCTDLLIKNSYHQRQEIVSVAILFSRYIIQITRIFQIYRSFKKHQELNNNQNIAFHPSFDSLQHQDL